jgi:ABC-type transport system involved in multi-copper enzyme maturation permease subunit
MNSLINVFTIARMTFLEARRNRIAWSMVVFCVVIVLTSFIFQEATIGSLDRIVRDVGLAAIHAFGALLAIFLGTSAVTREIERRTCYMLLSKQVSRWEYLSGKVLGVWITLVASLSLMLLAYIVELFFYGAAIDAVIFEAFWLILVELLVLTSFSVLASAATSSAMLAAFLSVGLFVVGHLSSDLWFFSRKSHVLLVRDLGKAAYFLIPDLEKLNLKDAASVLREVASGEVISSTIYGLIYVVAFVLLAVALFARRDLK